MILKTQALALRTYPYSNTSLIAVWLTPTGRRVATLMKGARRPKSPFLGQVDFGYRCELLYYRRERDGLHIASACTVLDGRDALRTDWRACGAASYVAALLLACINEADDHPALYALAEAALQRLAGGHARPELLYWFELQLLHQLGLAPRLDACTACGRLLRAEAAVTFAPGRGGAICAGCPPAPDSQTVRLTPDVRALMRRWQTDSAGRTLASTRCRAQQKLVFRRILGMFLVYHLDVQPDGREIAFDMINSGTPHQNGEKS